MAVDADAAIHLNLTSFRMPVQDVVGERVWGGPRRISAIIAAFALPQEYLLFFRFPNVDRHAFGQGRPDGNPARPSPRQVAPRGC